MSDSSERVKVRLAHDSRGLSTWAVGSPVVGPVVEAHCGRNQLSVGRKGNWPW